MSASPYIFDGPDADVILRGPLQLGSDEFRDFHVHKLILSIASGVFRDILAIPQPLRHTSGDATLDVIDVTEPATVIEPFLQLIYPVDPPVIEDLQLVDELFRLADKYAAKGVSTKLKKFLVSPSFLKDDPIGVFVIARRSRLVEEERLAVSHTFSIDVVDRISGENLQTMMAETYHHLLTEHARRRQRLIAAIDEGLRQALGGSCSCVENLKKEIRLRISGRPFLDRELLDTCFSSVRDLKKRGYQCTGGGCIYEAERGAIFLSGVMRAIQAIPM
jgi:hypothetical protein